jgi:hypothetical protein
MMLGLNVLKNIFLRLEIYLGVKVDSFLICNLRDIFYIFDREETDNH